MSSSDLSIYTDEEMLQLSGIQHFVFCPRQWALIHLEQVWADNALTMEGSLLHQNVDNPFFREKGHSAAITLRGFRLASPRLGLSGIADAVEIYPFPNAPDNKKDILKSLLFEAIPIEYKRGKPKLSDCDRMQVAAQALILEEMLKVDIDKGAIFYWETRHREYINIDEDMKRRVMEISSEMHLTARSGILAPAVRKKHCNNCSLLDYCLPSLSGKSAKKYIQNSFSEIEVV